MLERLEQLDPAEIVPNIEGNPDVSEKVYFSEAARQLIADVHAEGIKSNWSVSEFIALFSVPLSETPLERFLPGIDDNEADITIIYACNFMAHYRKAHYIYARNKG